MKNKFLLLITLMLTLCIFSSGFAVGAQEFSYDTDAVSFTLKANGINIEITGSLKSKAAEKYAALLVTNPETSLDDWGSDTVVQNQMECLTNENGGFSFVFTINTDAPDVVKAYPSFIKVQGMSAPLGFDIPLITQSARDSALAILNGSDATTISTNLDAVDDALVFEFLDVLGSIDTTALETKILARIPFESDSVASDWLKKEIVLEALRQSKTQHLVDDNGLLLFTEETGLSTMDTANNLSVYEIYTTKLTKTGSANVLAYISGKAYQDTQALQKEFAKVVVMEGIRNYNVDGTGHINGLLTTNGAYAGLDLSKYTGDTNAKDMELLVNKYGTLPEIQTVLNKTTTTDPGTDDPSDDGGSTGGSGGGGGGGRDYAIAPEVIEKNESVTPEIEQEPIYFITDVSKDYWGAEAINAMLKANIISMPDDKRFRPEDAVTREEFVKLLVLTFDIPVKEEAEAIFTDVTSDKWSASYVYAAHSAGIVNGIGDGMFGAQDTLSRQDMATMIYRAFKYCGLEAEGDNTITFTDDASISDYAREAVYSLCKAGAINGMDDGSFAPTNLCTRAQSAKVLYAFVD